MKGVNGVSVTLDTHTDNLGSNIGDLVSVGLNNRVVVVQCHKAEIPAVSIS